MAIRITIAYKNPDGTTDSRSINIANPPVPDPSQDPKASSAEAARYQEQLKQVVKQREELSPGVPRSCPIRRRTNLPFRGFKDTDKNRGPRHDRTPNFTVRTSEKESRARQASLDRLLRGKDGNPLMKKSTWNMTAFRSSKGGGPASLL